MRILFVSSEAVPFVKTGGLADVAGALAKAFHERGHDVRLVIPRYGDIDSDRYRLLPLMPEMKVEYAGQTLYGSVLRCSYPKTDMPVYFIDEPNLFGRKGVYGGAKGEFGDNDRRFAFFNFAALWMLKGLDWQPDIIHTNDWPTGLLPVLLKKHPVVSAEPFFQNIKTVFTIHNIAYQGRFHETLLPNCGLPWDIYNQDGMEFFGAASMLKGGVMFADELTTVSPTYAKEIQTEEYGVGMQGALQKRADHLAGIVNGVDLGEWNPEDDPHVAAPFSIKDLSGKAKCKEGVQRTLGLPASPDVPLIGIISRLTGQKGFTLVDQALDELLSLNVQIAVLGSGESRFEDMFRAAEARYPHRVRVRIGYDIPLSHQIIAGSDMFLMPSLYEPCGLTQIYSMRYGTVPVVRLTGGLADTVVQATPETVKDGSGTGFFFHEYSAHGMLGAVRAALNAFHNQRDSWRQIQANGMKQDWGWDRSAEAYEALYAKLKG